MRKQFYQTALGNRYGLIEVTEATLPLALAEAGTRLNDPEGMQ